LSSAKLYFKGEFIKRIELELKRIQKYKISLVEKLEELGELGNDLNKKLKRKEN